MGYAPSPFEEAQARPDTSHPPHRLTGQLRRLVAAPGVDGEPSRGIEDVHADAGVLPLERSEHGADARLVPLPDEMLHGDLHGPAQEPEIPVSRVPQIPG